MKNAKLLTQQNPPHLISVATLPCELDKLPPHALLVELMINSDSHVTLRLTVFEIFAVKWQKSVSERAKNGSPEALFYPAFGQP